MKSSMRSRLEQLSHRLAEIDAMLAEPDSADDMDRFRKLTRERAELEPVVRAFESWERACDDQATARELLADPDMKALAEEELAGAQERIDRLEAELQILLLPRDPDDDRSVFLEIRAGTGGDESALFAGDLLRMYMRYAETRGWRVELMSESASELGGYKEVIAHIQGEGVYGQLKFESGAHRVQRVPETESQGRVHTSACTVAVMPEADLPTGLVVECQDDRSQHRNKDKAMQVLAARLKDRQQQEVHAREAAQRKSLVGSGDRSERIRTYNFPQGRVTDHRINLTLYKLAQVMDGDLNDVTNALLAEHQAEQLAALALD
jgi:peptide chain release factor 1